MAEQHTAVQMLHPAICLQDHRNAGTIHKCHTFHIQNQISRQRRINGQLHLPQGVAGAVVIQLAAELQQQLETALAEIEELKNVPEGDVTTQELEAYRRAERTEREARERADRMTKEAEAALTDMRRIVGESSDRLSTLMDAWTAAVELTREEILSVSEALPREE